MGFSLGDCLFFVGMLIFISSLHHYLFLLLSLEFLSLTVFLLGCFLFSSVYLSMDLSIFFIVVMVMEGIFGLSLLVFSVRGFGTDFFSLGY